MQAEFQPVCSREETERRRARTERQALRPHKAGDAATK